MFQTQLFKFIIQKCSKVIEIHNLKMFKNQKYSEFKNVQNFLSVQNS